MIVRAIVEVSPKELGKDRMIFTGTLDQIKADADACRKIGAHEVFFDPVFTHGGQSLGRWLELLEQLAP
jgi:hypothetical protein